MSGSLRKNHTGRESGICVKRVGFLLVATSIIALVACINASASFKGPLSGHRNTADDSTAAYEGLSTKNGGRALTTESFASDEPFATSWNDSSILPFGPQILDGYETCDEFATDVLEFLYAAAYSYIKQQKNYNCTSPGHPVSGCYDYNFTDFYGNIMEGGDCFNSYYDTINSTDDVYSTIESTSSGGSTASRRASEKSNSYGTNNLVNGVNENEMVKSDGDHIFVGFGSSIVVTDLDGNIIARAKVASSYTVSSLLLHNNTLMVIAYGSSPCGKFYYCPGRTAVFIYTFDPESSSLDLINQVNINGLPGEARNIGSRAIVFTSNQYYPGDFLDKFGRCSAAFENMTDDEYETAAFGVAKNVTNITLAQSIVKHLTQSPDGKNTQTCKNILKASRELTMTYSPGSVPSFVQMTSFDVADALLGGLNTSVYGVPVYTDPVVHLTNHSLLLGFMDPSNYHTLLISFDSSGATLTPKAVGDLEGMLVGNMNQLSLDYFDGYYRVATVTPGVYSSNYYDVITEPAPHIFVLQEQGSQLVTVGRVENLVVGEASMTTARFLADKGYVFTRDKLQVIDLSSPTQPKVISVLNQTVDFVDYIHPIENGPYLLTFGSSSDLKIGLFDLTDAVSPAELPSYTLTVPGHYISSDASWYYHAITYANEAHKLIIPAFLGIQSNDDDLGYDHDLFYVFDVNLTSGISFVGNVTRASRNYTDYIYCGGGDLPARRMVFGDELVTFYDSSIKSSDLSAPATTNWELTLNVCQI